MSDELKIAGAPSEAPAAVQEAPPPSSEVVTESPSVSAEVQPMLAAPPEHDDDSDERFDKMRREVEKLAKRLGDAEAAKKEHSSQLSAQRKAMTEAHLERLGVKPQYMEMAPDVDPFTTAGKKQLEAFYAERPELCATKPRADVNHHVKIAEATKDMPGGFLVNPKAVQDSFARLRKSLRGN